jgi:hypothetical protein
MVFFITEIQIFTSKGFETFLAASAAQPALMIALLLLLFLLVAFFIL